MPLMQNLTFTASCSGIRRMPGQGFDHPRLNLNAHTLLQKAYLDYQP